MTFFLARLQYPLLAGLLLFIAVATLNPDPFGNNPDIIGDESYFLSSSLNAIEKHTLPGWEFSVSGNYYGGVQTYIDTVVLIPVIGTMFATNHFSLLDTEMQIALYIGNLFSVLRLVNGLLFVAACGFFIFYFARPEIPSPLKQRLLLLLFLLLGNSLVIGFVHTAKVWTLYFILDAAVGALFIAQEYYLSRGLEPLVRKDLYLALMVWAATAAFFQNYVGALPVALWILYAIFLGHLELREVWRYIIKRWYWFVALFALNISFFYRAIFVKTINPAEVAVTSAGGGIDWYHRLHDPIVYAFGSQPLLYLSLFGLMAVFFAWRRTDRRKRLYYLIALAHPLIIYLVFHAIIGFSLFPRYSLPLTIALSFTVVMLIGEVAALRRVVFVAAGVLAAIVMSHAITLYWHPSSEVVITRELVSRLNSPANVFMFEPVYPKSSRLSLPTNGTSLLLLNERRQSMSRYQFLLQHLDLVDQFVSFKSVVVIPDTPAEATAYRVRFVSATTTSWTISSDCSKLCSDTEIAAGTCLEVNASTCGAYPQDIHMLADFLSYSQLGGTYIVRRAE